MSRDASALSLLGYSEDKIAEHVAADQEVGRVYAQLYEEAGLPPEALSKATETREQHFQCGLDFTVDPRLEPLRRKQYQPDLKDFREWKGMYAPGWKVPLFFAALAWFLFAAMSRPGWAFVAAMLAAWRMGVWSQWGETQLDGYHEGYVAGFACGEKLGSRVGYGAGLAVGVVRGRRGSGQQS